MATEEENDKKENLLMKEEDMNNIPEDGDNRISIEKNEEEEGDSNKNETEEIKIERLTEDIKTYDKSIKVILIGDSGVGKTNILLRLSKNQFNEKQNPTLSLEYFNYSIKINNYTIRMQIWDTAGKEKYNSVISNYCRTAEVSIFVYAINDEKSYNSIQEWHKELIVSHSDENTNIKKILLGNKKDLNSERQVDFKTAENFAKENGFLVFSEITCKNDDKEDIYTVCHIFDAISKIFYDEYNNQRIESYNYSSFNYLASASLLEANRNTQTSSKPNEEEEKKKCCCCSIY